MDGPGQFNERNFEQNMPAFPRIYLSVIRPSLAEFFGVYFLTFGLYACLVGDLRMLGFVAEIAVVFLFIGVYSITKKVSNGHLNPVITMVQIFRKGIQPFTGICYIVAHLLGAVLGALSVRVITTTKPYSPFKQQLLGDGHLIFAEMMGTCIVILAYLCLATKGKGNTAILGIGFGYAGALIAVHGFSMGYLNPALNFGISVASNNWEKHYVYWVGTVAGGVLAAILHGLIFASDDALWIVKIVNRRRYFPERIT